MSTRHVTIQLPSDPPITVVLDFARLEAIETAMGKSIFAILEGMSEFYEPVPDQPEGEEKKYRPVLSKLKVGTLLNMVCTVSGIDRQTASNSFGRGQLIGAFGVCVQGLTDAMKALTSTEDPEANPSETPSSPTPG